MKICFHRLAWEDYLHWQRSDPERLSRINQLIHAIQRDPLRGIGKPEPLKGNWSGFWSRRIDRQHRLVYAVTGDTPLIAQCRFNY